MTIALLVGLIGGCLAGFNAASKGRNSLIWFLVGMLLPVLGVVAALTLESPEVEQS